MAGNKKGKDDTRYLWPEFSRVVRDFRPRWIVAENVPGILTIAADTVCADLECQGYEVGIWDFEAASVGAKHRRERVFFIAHTRRTLRQRISETRDFRETHETRNAVNAERPNSAHIPATEGITWKLAKSRICGGIDGFSRRMDGDISPVVSGVQNRAKRLRALGNAVVPQQAYPVFFAVMEADKA